MSPARVLAGYVRPRTDSRGLSVPEKMEYVVRTIGCARVIAAAVGGAMTRPLGVRGAFYLLAGSVARDIDGGRPPYEGLLFPPLDPAAARVICAELGLAAGAAVIEAALDLLTEPQEMYRQAGRATRRLLNLAFFTRLYVDGPEVTEDRLAEPFDEILYFRRLRRWGHERRQPSNAQTAPGRTPLTDWGPRRAC